MAVLAHGGSGVAVDVEAVRNLLPEVLTVPDPQPHWRLGPGRRSGGRLAQADLRKTVGGAVSASKTFSAALNSFLDPGLSCQFTLDPPDGDASTLQ